MNLINTISCRERACSLLLLLLTSESCRAWETGGSFIVSLLPGARDAAAAAWCWPSHPPVTKGKGHHFPPPAPHSFPLPLSEPPRTFTSAGTTFPQTNFLLHLKFPVSHLTAPLPPGLLIGLKFCGQTAEPKERCLSRMQLCVGAFSRGALAGGAG